MALKTVRLYGKLGSTFGRVHKLDIRTPAEAIRALCCTIAGFEIYLRNAKRNGVTFACFKGSENISGDDVLSGIGDREFRIAPIITGAKKSGLFQTIIGVALLAVAIFAPWGTAFAASNFLGALGASIALGGVIQMLTPQPGGMSIAESADNKPNYAFGSPVNTTAQGKPMPILWGKREVGGAIISASIIANEVY
ncbi:tail protein [Pectobacterium phage Ymer]|uniref:Tail protein n=3 Tax=unclassified Caudoviricetes TaxID=2788787 RepID=A0AB39AC16_9CAUD|nr:tail tip assembly protein I [Pectobacterium phage Abuela]WCD42784.1 tail assembly protein [Pectobacterium phage Ymer]